MRLFNAMKRYRIDIILVIALFILALGIRSLPADRFPGIYGFDSYWAARMTKYLITGENLAQKGWPLVNVPDYTTDYPYGRQGTLANELGFWLLNANLYKFTATLEGINGFDYDLFGRLDSWMNAVYGALAIPAIYLFGRVAFSRWVGLGSALFLATSANHLFYSIFGHAENDALGFALFFFSLFALAATMRNRDIRFGILATFFLTLLSMVWQTYEVVALSVAPAIVIYFAAVVMLRQVGYYQDSPERRERRKWAIYAMLFALASVVPSLVLTHSNYGATGIAAFGGATLFGCLAELALSRKGLSLKMREGYPDRALIISVVALAIGGLVYGTALITSPLGRAGIDISFGGQPYVEPDYGVRMIQTIAEQNPVAGNDFIERLGTLANSGFGITIWLSLLAAMVALAKVFIMPLKRKDFTYEWDLMLAIFILFALYGLTSKSINIFFLAAPASLGAGYFFGIFVRLFEVLGQQLGASVRALARGATFGVMLAASFGFLIAALPTADSFGYDVNPEWWSTFKFLNSPAVPQGAVITAWWDYGHWMNYFNGEKIHTTHDNIQDRKDIIYTVASSFTHTPPCRYDQNTKQITCETSTEALELAELESLSLLKPLKTTHILIDREIVGGATGGKFGALEHIANNNIGCMQTLGCTLKEDNSTLCIFGKDPSTNQDVGLSFSPEQWAMMKAVPWPGLNLAERGVPTRIFGRDDSGGSTIYMSALSCGQFQPDASSPVLYGFTQRLFFKDPNLKHVRLVYDDSWNVIYEVDWTGVPDPQNFTAWTKERHVLPELAAGAGEGAANA